MATVQWCIVVLALVCALGDCSFNKRKYSKTFQKYSRSLLDLNYQKRQGTCGPDQFHCNDGECVSIEWYCDTDRDCNDGTDEINCPTDCSGAHQFKCNNDRCITRQFVCDGQDDCTDNSDEWHCDEVECVEGQVKCDINKCIPEFWLCDGDNDCGTGWDESNCTEVSCRDYQFPCADGSRCIPSSWRCDGGADCADHSDEIDCVCDNSTHFLCPNHRCIPINWLCDHDNDCGDATDELGCPPLHPSVCRDIFSTRDCLLLNESTHPICHDPIDGHRFCRQFCGLCDPDVTQEP